jgi:hypothetical protein
MIAPGIRDLAAALSFYETGPRFPQRHYSPPRLLAVCLLGPGQEALAEAATVSADGEGFEAFAFTHHAGAKQWSMKSFQGRWLPLPPW